MQQEIDYGPTGVRPDKQAECYLPDYPSDLNAMHEAEKEFWNEDKGDSSSLVGNYLAHLTKMKNGVPWLVFHATAAQRAEAFLRTLNLWTTG